MNRKQRKSTRVTVNNLIQARMLKDTIEQRILSLQVELREADRKYKKLFKRASAKTVKEAFGDMEKIS